jgi:cytochrome P450
VRVNPNEIHVNDPSFYPILYRAGGGRRDKWPWAASMFGNNTSVFSTIAHDHHRLRRAALNPLFSKRRIRELEPEIQRHLDRLCERLDEFCKSGQVLNIGLAFAVFAADVISAYCFGDPLGLLNDPDFAPEWVQRTAAPSELSHLVKQCPWVLPVSELLPRRLVEWLAPSIGQLFAIQEVSEGVSETFV